MSINSAIQLKNNIFNLYSFIIVFMSAGNSEYLVPRGGKTGVGGWHNVQFAGGRNSPTKFNLTLYWVKNTTSTSQKEEGQEMNKQQLLKLRTDVNRVTPRVEQVLKKLPSWCSLFGKSTSPFTLAFLASIPVDF